MLTRINPTPPGNLEAVTTWSGLLAANTVLGADVVVVADGPGNLGTETTWGVSALRSGESLNAAGILRRPDVQGALVGGASLKASDFLAIIQAA